MSWKKLKVQHFKFARQCTASSMQFAHTSFFRNCRTNSLSRATCHEHGRGALSAVGKNSKKVANKKPWINPVAKIEPFIPIWSISQIDERFRDSMVHSFLGNFVYLHFGRHYVRKCFVLLCIGPCFVGRHAPGTLMSDVNRFHKTISKRSKALVTDLLN